MSQHNPCLHCGKKKRLHARSLCSNCYQRHAQDYPRTKKHRPWTARERQLLRDQWGKRDCASLAAELGRDPKDVYSAARRFGIERSGPAYRRPDAKEHLAMLKLHAQGLTDREIAGQLGRAHGTVTRRLRRAGLAANGRRCNTDTHVPRTCQRIQTATLERIAAEGIENEAFQRKHVEGRIAALKLGWHCAQTELEARLLDALQSQPEQTLASLQTCVGRQSHWVGQVLRGLKRRGLVQVLTAAGPVTTPGGKYCRYVLAPGVDRVVPKGGRVLHQKVLLDEEEEAN